MKDSVKYSRWIKDKAKKLGFTACGISKAGFLEEEAPHLESYLNKNYQGKMAYMANHFDKRLNPTLLVEGAKSVISLSYNYHTEKKQDDPSAPKISKYAYGMDYHFVVKEKLNELFQFILDEIGEIDGRVFVDSAPVLDRAWAQKAGLGWIGKNGMLITHMKGSFFFLAELIIDLELEPDQPINEYCGSCTRCIDACPTDAIVDSKVIDGSKCISYFTIELKDEIPSSMKGKLDNWMFGCDVCQDVCPWNRFSITHDTRTFEPHPELLTMNKNDWRELSADTFGKIFKGSAVKRTKFKGLSRNIRFLSEDLE